MAITNNTLKNLTSKGSSLARRITYRVQHKQLEITKAGGNFIGITDAYQVKREQLITTLTNLGVSNNSLKQIKNANTLGELFVSIMQFSKTLTQKEAPIIPKNIKRTTRSIPLQLEQEIYKFKNFRSNCVRNLHTIFNTKSTNPEVVKIENILNKKYKIQTALLGNDLEVAKKVLEAVKLAKSKGIKLPNEIIVSEFSLGGGEFMRSFKDGNEINTILLPSIYSRNTFLTIKNNILTFMPTKYKQLLENWKNFCGFKEHGSTTSPIHMEIHEIMHQTHTPLIAFLNKKIPSKFMPVVRRLSEYSAINENFNFEIYTELATKNVLEKLEPDEAELFKFLGGDV